jgi:hypothetical protein
MASPEDFAASPALMTMPTGVGRVQRAVDFSLRLGRGAGDVRRARFALAAGEITPGAPVSGAAAVLRFLRPKRIPTGCSCGNHNGTHNVYYGKYTMSATAVPMLLLSLCCISGTPLGSFGERSLWDHLTEGTSWMPAVEGLVGRRNRNELARALGYAGRSVPFVRYLRIVVLRESLVRRAISRMDIPSRRCQRRITLSNATSITPRIPCSTRQDRGVHVGQS